MKTKIKDTTVFVLILLLAGWIYFGKEKNTKVGFIDLAKTFSEFELKKDLEAKYKTEIKGRKIELDSLGFSLKKEEIDLEGLQKTDQIKVDNFLSRKKKYFELLKTFEEESIKTNTEYDTQIYKQLNQFVEEFGKEKEYAIIYGSSGNGNIMFGSKSHDLTDEVIKYINKKYNGETER